MSQEVKVLNFGFTTRGRKEIIDWLLTNSLRGKLLAIVQDDLSVEERVTSTRGLVGCVAIIKLLSHNVFHLGFGVFVQLGNSADHLLD